LQCGRCTSRRTAFARPMVAVEEAAMGAAKAKPASELADASADAADETTAEPASEAASATGEAASAASVPGDDYEEPEELVELQLIEEDRLEKLFEELRRERGLDDDATLATFFKLFDMWIQLYRLNKCAEVLEDVVPVCRKRGGQLQIKGVQALAFTRWKQGKFKVAAELFHEIEDLVGSSAALCENMGHTYSSMGNFPEASKYFQRALLCLDEEQKLGKKSGNRAGVLLGLGLIEDRQGHLPEALTFCREAQKLFREKAAGKPASLVAKAGMSIAKILLKIAREEEDETLRQKLEEEAVERERENVQIFEITCGDDSPLTASALKGLGEALMRRLQTSEAQQSFARAYLLEAQKDAFDLIQVMEIHNSLVGAHMLALQNGEALDRSAFKTYMPTVEVALGRVRAMKQDGNAGAYYKVAGELRAFAEDYAGASELLSEAVRLFIEEDQAKCAGLGKLIKDCTDLKSFCDTQIPSRGSQASGAKATEESQTKPPVDKE